MNLKTLKQIASETGLMERSLQKRAISLGFEKIGRQYILNEEQVKKLLDPSLHKRGKRAKKKAPEN